MPLIQNIEEALYLLMNRLFHIMLFLGLFSVQVQSQQTRISGFVEDKSSGEKLIGSYVTQLNTLTGTTTDEFGFFSLTVPENDSTRVLIT